MLHWTVRRTSQRRGWEAKRRRRTLAAPALIIFDGPQRSRSGVPRRGIELMKANVITTLEYARELGGTTTAAEFVELSSAQARKQCELILRQAGALRSLAQTITKSSAD